MPITHVLFAHLVDQEPEGLPSHACRQSKRDLSEVGGAGRVGALSLNDLHGACVAQASLLLRRRSRRSARSRTGQASGCRSSVPDDDQSLDRDRRLEHVPDDVRQVEACRNRGAGADRPGWSITGNLKRLRLGPEGLEERGRRGTGFAPVLVPISTPTQPIVSWASRSTLGCPYRVPGAGRWPSIARRSGPRRSAIVAEACR